MPYSFVLRFSAVIALGFFSGGGCARWSTGDAARFQLPIPAAAPDSVALEIATLGLSAEKVGGEGSFWREVDEQAIPRDARESLARCGLRCGVVAGPLPQELRERLDLASQSGEKVDDTAISDAASHTSVRRVQNRAGRRSKIVVGEEREEMVVLVPEGERLRGEICRQAQCLFSLKAFPQSDGRVQLELIPEVEHGVPRQRAIGQAHDATFRLDFSKDRMIFETLRVSATLAAGQTLVVSCTPDCKGLGRQFFAEAAAGACEERIVLIRVAQTRADELFSPSAVSEPLTTPLD